MKQYAWGIIGCSEITPKFIRGMNAIPEGKIQGIGSRDKIRAKKFAETYEIPFSGTYQEIYKNPTINIIYINNTNNLHKQSILESLANNKHVLCEKPMCPTYEDTQEVIAYAKQKKLFLMEGLWARFLPIYKIFHKLKEDFLGDIYKIDADFGFEGNKNPQRRLLNPDLIGGTLMDNGIYLIGLAHEIFEGTPTKIESTAEFGKTSVDETTKCELHFSNNKRAILESSIVQKTPQNATICGTKGTIEISTFWKANALTYNKKVRIECGQEEPDFRDEIREVHECLKNKDLESKIMSHQHSLEISKTMQTIRQQIHT